MYTVGLDVDTLVSTKKKILLYARNSLINGPLILFMLGIIYLFQYNLTGQFAGNFRFSTKTTSGVKNTYNKYSNLPTISDHVPLTDNELGYFLAGLNEGDGKKELLLKNV